MLSRRGLLLAIAVGCGTTVPAPVRAQPASPEATSSQLAALTQGYAVHDELFNLVGRSLPIRFVLKPEAAGHRQRLITATTAALTRLSGWHGPLPHTELIVMDVPWNSDLAGVSLPGVIVVSTSTFATPMDRAVDRMLFAAVARQYWYLPAAADATRHWLGEALASYAAIRGIHEELVREHAATIPLFGGIVSHSITSMPLSLPAFDPRPPLRGFVEIDAHVASSAEAKRAARALFTLDRYLGWAAMQQAIETFYSHWHAGPAGPDELAAIVSEQRGTDLRWFFDEAFRFTGRFDYGIASFSSEPSRAVTGEFETRVSLRRFGDAVFAGTSEPRAPLQAGRSLKVQTRFEDGAAVEDWWDGRDATLELVYTAPSRAISSSVDPDAMLLLDDDRRNNTRVATPEWTAGVARLTALWMVWLQDVMLASSSLL